MGSKFSTSANIIRDEHKSLEYLVTPNSAHVATEICDSYRKGIHSFTLIGSYGTGKSSFLLAFHESLERAKPFNINLGIKTKNVQTLRVVGQYQSLIKYFRELFNIEDDFDGNQKILNHLYELSGECDLLVIYLDEFGKFLEYASSHEPDKELYFLQQLAELVNGHEREILLISTLHQNFEAYGANMAQDSQKKEWRKVKGRFKELTFNEPVEQLLLLAAEKLGGERKASAPMAGLAKAKHLLGIKGVNLESVEQKLAPLDIISATVLTKALQHYGQNERSLFTFLESDIGQDEWVSVPKVYDYLLNSFYSFLHSSYNPHYRHWQAMQAGVERIEALDLEDTELSLAIYKTVGLLHLFGNKGAQVDTETLEAYFEQVAEKGKVTHALDELKSRKLILFAKYKESFKIIEGTDVDFDHELNRAEEDLDRSFNIPSILQEHFEFPFLQAKEVSYRTGTPRLFEFEISTEVLSKLNPVGATDGYVNLVFNPELSLKEVKEQSTMIENAVVVGYFTNSQQIEDRIFEILKTKKVMADNAEDLVAKQEFQKIIASNERLLSHEVMGSLYSDKVRWFFKGTERKDIRGPKSLNKFLSDVCFDRYSATPIFKNELLNKHKISSSIHTARKNYFLHLSDHWNEPGLGFESDRFPPEKTIYQTLLEANGMCKEIDGRWDLGEPIKLNGFDKVWEACGHFLKAAQHEKKNISELWTILSSQPFKLKLGLIDFWVPTFLFTNRGDFALYEGEKFIPVLNDSVMYLMTRQPHKYQVKSFEISDLRVRVFNKYREVLDQESQGKIRGDKLVESLKPFLVFYKSLNSYAQNTKRLSEEALALRSAITSAKDLEETFFSAIPKAMKWDMELTASTDAKLSEFAVRLNEAIQELKHAFPELLNRFESFLCNEILDKKIEFEGYKTTLAERYSNIKEHKLLPKQKTFVARLNSPLSDRDSWLASIAQALLGKSIDQITDQEEELLKDRLRHMILELDNLLELHAISVDEGDQVFKLDLTNTDGLRSLNVRISKAKQKEVGQVFKQVSKLLSKHKNVSLAVLSKLIEKELEQ